MTTGELFILFVPIFTLSSLSLLSKIVCSPWWNNDLKEYENDDLWCLAWLWPVTYWSISFSSAWQKRPVGTRLHTNSFGRPWIITHGQTNDLTATWPKKRSEQGRRFLPFDHVQACPCVEVENNSTWLGFHNQSSAVWSQLWYYRLLITRSLRATIEVLLRDEPAPVAAFYRVKLHKGSKRNDLRALSQILMDVDLVVRLFFVFIAYILANWTGLALEGVLFSLYQNSRNNFSFQWQNSMTHVSVAVRPPCWCPSEGEPRFRPWSVSPRPKLKLFAWFSVKVTTCSFQHGLRTSHVFMALHNVLGIRLSE